MLICCGESVEPEIFVVFVFHLGRDHVDLLVGVVVLRGVLAPGLVEAVLVIHGPGFVVGWTFAKVDCALGQLSFRHGWSRTLKTTLLVNSLDAYSFGTGW